MKHDLLAWAYFNRINFSAMQDNQFSKRELL